MKLEHKKFHSNIKQLPKGYYFSGGFGSDCHAYKVIAETAKTKTLAKVEVKTDPDWQPEFHAGGFVAHCSNSREQTWIFDKIDFESTIKIRLTKNGWSEHGARYVGNIALEIYDYNF